MTSCRPHRQPEQQRPINFSSFQLYVLEEGHLPGCGGLTLAGLQVPTKAVLSPHSSTGQRRENIMKGLWVEIRTGRDRSPITAMGKTDLTCGKII